MPSGWSITGAWREGAIGWVERDWGGAVYYSGLDVAAASCFARSREKETREKETRENAAAHTSYHPPSHSHSNRPL